MKINDTSVAFQKRSFWVRLQVGYKRIIRSKIYTVILWAIIIGIFCIWKKCAEAAFDNSILGTIGFVVNSICLLGVLIIGILWGHSQPFFAMVAHDALKRAEELQ